MLIVFDCDGVLVDSEVLVGRIEADMLAVLGAPISFEMIVERFMGLSDATMAEALRTEWGVELPDTFDEERTRRVASRFEQDLEPIAGIDAVLQRLVDRGVPRCVASSSAPARIAQSLTRTGLIDYFGGRLYSASMVARGKPAPDLFLHAAADLGVEPTECVVIEDSPPGVQAGVAAGMHVIGFVAAGHCGPNHADRLHAAGAHQVVGSSAELSAVLALLTWAGS